MRSPELPEPSRSPRPPLPEHETICVDPASEDFEIVGVVVGAIIGPPRDEIDDGAAARQMGTYRTAEVIRTEEKGSDVNLAVHLLNDGWLDAYDCAVVVGNDSDIAEAMRLVRHHHGKRIGLRRFLMTRSNRGSHELSTCHRFERGSLR